MDFVALDVETANADLSSICAVGAVAFRNGVASEAWYERIDPEDFFSPANVVVHGITEDDVRGMRTFREAFADFGRLISNTIVVTHTQFDRVAISRAADRYGLDAPTCRWLDSAKVARRAWSEFSARGYSLWNLASHFGIDYEPHNAVEDARAAGEVLVHAIDATGLSIEAWLDRVKQPLSGTASSKIAIEGNPDGPLFGEVAVFTGALSMPRREAAQVAAHAGCRVAPSVTKATTLLVVGDQDVRKVGNDGKSSKHRRVEELIAQGLPIRIVGEGDFVRLVETG